jgi:hypothetical protein
MVKKKATKKTEQPKDYELSWDECLKAQVEMNTLLNPLMEKYHHRVLYTSFLIRGRGESNPQLIRSYARYSLPLRNFLFFFFFLPQSPVWTHFFHLL